MKVNSFNQQQFTGVVARETKKPEGDIQKETFSFSKENEFMKSMKSDQLVSLFKVSGGMNVAADGVIESCALQGISISDDENSKQIVDMAIMNSGAVTLIARDILTPLSPAVIPADKLLFSGAKKVDENVIYVDLNTVASDEDALKKDFMANEPSHRLYIGIDSESDKGFVYSDKLK